MLNSALGQAHRFDDEENAVRRKEYFVLVTMNPETTKTSELNTRQLEQREFNFNGIHVDVVGSANNKAKTLGMGNVNGRKFTEKKEGEKE